jgi:hypothetical protein
MRALASSPAQTQDADEELWSTVDDDVDAADAAADRMLDDLVGAEEARDSRTDIDASPPTETGAAESAQPATEHEVGTAAGPSVGSGAVTALRPPRKRVSLKPVASAAGRAAKAGDTSGATDESVAEVREAIASAVAQQEADKNAAAPSPRGAVPSAAEAAAEAERLRRGLRPTASSRPTQQQRPSAGAEVPIARVRAALPPGTVAKIGSLTRWLRMRREHFDVSGDGVTVALRGEMSAARLAPVAGFKPKVVSAATSADAEAEAAAVWFTELDLDGPEPPLEELTADDDEAAVARSLQAVAASRQGSAFHGAMPSAPSLASVVAAAPTPAGSVYSSITHAHVVGQRAGAGSGVRDDRMAAGNRPQAMASVPLASVHSVPPPPAGTLQRRPPPRVSAMSGRATPPALAGGGVGLGAGAIAAGPAWRAPSEMLDLFVDIVPTYWVSMQFLRATRELQDALGGAHTALSLPRVLKKYQFYFEVRRPQGGGTVLDVRLRDTVNHPRKGAANSAYEWARTDGGANGGGRSGAPTPAAAAVKFRGAGGPRGTSGDSAIGAAEPLLGGSLADYMAQHPEGLLKPIDRSRLASMGDDAGPPRKWGAAAGAAPASSFSAAAGSSAANGATAVLTPQAFFASAPGVLALLSALPVVGPAGEPLKAAPGVPYASWTCESLARYFGEGGASPPPSDALQLAIGARPVPEAILALTRTRRDVFLYCTDAGTPLSGPPTERSVVFLRPLQVSPGATGAFGAGESSPVPAVVAALGRVVPRGLWAPVARVESKLKPEEREHLEKAGRPLVDIARAHGRLLWVAEDGSAVRRFTGEAELDDIAHFALPFIRDAVAKCDAPAEPGVVVPDPTMERLLDADSPLMPAAIASLLRAEGPTVVCGCLRRHKSLFAVAEPVPSNGFSGFTVGRASAFRGR